MAETAKVRHGYYTGTREEETHTERNAERNDEQRHEHANGMVSMAEKVERHHVEPAPEAVPPTPDPFPALLWRGLGWSVLVGLVVGALIAWLMLRGTLVISGWEGLFSMVPPSFCAFWMMIGAALDVLVGGVGMSFAAPSTAHRVE